MQNQTQNEEKLYQHPLWSDYACTLDGSVFSKKYNPCGNKSGEFKKLKPAITTSGYLQFDIRINNKSISKYVHQFVYECCTQSVPVWGCLSDSPTINHNDNNKLNNDFNNLIKIPQRDNIKLREDFKPENKKSGLPLSVYYQKNIISKPFYVRIYYQGKQLYFGHYATIQEAEEVAIAKRKELFPNE